METRDDEESRQFSATRWERSAQRRGEVGKNESSVCCGDCGRGKKISTIELSRMIAEA